MAHKFGDLKLICINFFPTQKNAGGNECHIVYFVIH